MDSKIKTVSKKTVSSKTDHPSTEAVALMIEIVEKRKLLQLRKKSTSSGSSDQVKSLMNRRNLVAMKDAVVSLSQAMDEVIALENQIKILMCDHREKLNEANKPGNILVKIKGGHQVLDALKTTKRPVSQQEIQQVINTTKQIQSKLSKGYIEYIRRAAEIKDFLKKK